MLDLVGRQKGAMVPKYDGDSEIGVWRNREGQPHGGPYMPCWRINCILSEMGATGSL